MDNIFNRKFMNISSETGQKQINPNRGAKQNNLLEFLVPHVQQKMKPITNFKRKIDWNFAWFSRHGRTVTLQFVSIGAHNAYDLFALSVCMSSDLFKSS